MSKLEQSVELLAEALDGLEARLDDKIRAADFSDEALDSARNQARMARQSANMAAREIAQSMNALRALIAKIDQSEG